MATTDHPLVLDLGSIIGPTGPRGPSGLSTTSGEPSSSVGSDGDVMVDPATGIFYKKTSSAWAAICTFLLNPMGPTPTTMTPAAQGETYPGVCEAYNFGGIGYFAMNGTSQDPDVWSKTINIGIGASATPIIIIPSAIRPKYSTVIQGRLYTQEHQFRAEFVLHGNTGDSLALKLTCKQIANIDWSPVTSGVTTTTQNNETVTQVVATGFDAKTFYMIDDQQG